MFALAGALADVCKSPAAERLSWRHLCDTLFVTSGKVLTSPQIWLPHNDWLWQIPHMPPHSSLLLQGPGPAVLSSATDTTVPGLRLLFPSAFRDKALQSCPKPRDTIVPACGHHSLRPEAPGGSRRLPEAPRVPGAPRGARMQPDASCCILLHLQGRSTRSSRTQVRAYRTPRQYLASGLILLYNGAGFPVLFC